MEIEPLEVYARDSNYAVIKPPGRNYPGCVIQGDSLAIVCRKIRAIAKGAEVGRPVSKKIYEDIADLNDALIDRILHYQQVLAAHKIELPYGRAFDQRDLVQPEVSE